MEERGRILYILPYNVTHVTCICIHVSPSFSPLPLPPSLPHFSLSLPLSLPPSLSPSLPLPPSSTNLTELAKAVRLLAALNPTDLTGDELLRAARNLAAATAGLLNAAKPENVEVRRTPLKLCVRRLYYKERKEGEGEG